MVVEGRGHQTSSPEAIVGSLGSSPASALGPQSACGVAMFSLRGVSEQAHLPSATALENARGALPALRVLLDSLSPFSLP